MKLEPYIFPVFLSDFSENYDEYQKYDLPKGLKIGKHFQRRPRDTGKSEQDGRLKELSADRKKNSIEISPGVMATATKLNTAWTTTASCG